MELIIEIDDKLDKTIQEMLYDHYIRYANKNLQVLPLKLPQAITVMNRDSVVIDLKIKLIPKYTASVGKMSQRRLVPVSGDLYYLESEQSHSNRSYPNGCFINLTDNCINETDVRLARAPQYWIFGSKQNLQVIIEDMSYVPVIECSFQSQDLRTTLLEPTDQYFEIVLTDLSSFKVVVKSNDDSDDGW